jgi:PPOX class probable F420-dependent enzyme
MPASVPAKYLDLLEGPVVVSFVTIQPDGGPQVTPVWCWWDGEHLLINTAAARQKHKNVLANPKVAALIIDPNNMNRWIEIRGTVVQVETDQTVAVGHIDLMAKLYRGVDSFFGDVLPPGTVEERITFVIRPDKVNAAG